MIAPEPQPVPEPPPRATVRRLLATRALAAAHPVVLTFILGAVFSYLTGDTVRAGYLGAVGLALAWDSARRRGKRLPGEATRTTADPPAAVPDVPAATVRPGASGVMAVFSRESAAQRRAAMDRLLLPAIAAGIVFAVAVGWLQRYSWPATVSVTAVATAAVVAAWVVSAGSPNPPRKLHWPAVIAWAMVWFGAAGWELTALFLQPALTTNSYAHPTLSNLANPMLASMPGRASVLFAWLALGWYLARR